MQRLVFLHLRFHGYSDEVWSDAAVRRYARDAGPLLDDLNELTRCDCTTRNERKARMLAARMDALEARIAELREREELGAIRPDIDGNRVMELLGVGPGRHVGEALSMLLEARLDEGPLALRRPRAACPGLVGRPAVGVLTQRARHRTETGRMRTLSVRTLAPATSRRYGTAQPSDAELLARVRSGDGCGLRRLRAAA